MIKFFCDKCKTEIEQSDKLGTFTHIEEEFALEKTTVNTMATKPHLVEKRQIFCEDCTKEIVKTIEKR